MEENKTGKVDKGFYGDGYNFKYMITEDTFT